MRILALLLALVAGLYALIAGDLIDRDLLTPFTSAWPEGSNWRAGALAVWYGLPGVAIVAGLLALIAPGSAAALLLLAALGWGAIGLVVPELATPELAIAPGAAFIAALFAFIAGEWQVRSERAMRRRLRDGRRFADEEEDEEAEDAPPPRRFAAAETELNAREAALNAVPELLAREPRPAPALASLATQDRRSEPVRSLRSPPDWAVSPRREPDPEAEFDPFTRRNPPQIEVPQAAPELEPEPAAAPRRPPPPAPPPPVEAMPEREPQRTPRVIAVQTEAPARRGIGVGAALLAGLNLIVVAALAGLSGYLVATHGLPGQTGPVAQLATPVAVDMPVAPAAATESWDDPFAYCAAVGTVDAPDGRYAGPPVPISISAGVRAPATATADRVKWRCYEGRVLGCKAYAWPVCDRVPTTAELAAYCTQNPDSPRLLAPAGTWSCVGGQPRLPAGISWARDARGFEAAGWSAIPKPASP